VRAHHLPTPGKFVVLMDESIYSLCVRAQNELNELITKLNPTKIIPIHTEHLKIFEQRFPGKVIDLN
jgi:hypothetical protein